jgi:hypothetical protein
LSNLLPAGERFHYLLFPFDKQFKQKYVKEL